MMRPFAAERPLEYPAKPAPIRSRQGLSHLPPICHGTNHRNFVRSCKHG